MDILTFIWMMLPLIRITSLLIFFGGILLVIIRWGRTKLKDEECNFTETTYQIPWCKKLSVALKAITLYWLLGMLIYKRSRVRWLAHTCILVSSTGLLIFHIIPRVIFGTTEVYLFPNILILTWNTIHSALCVMFMFGVAIALTRRLVQKGVRWATKVRNLTPLFLLLLIGLIGFSLDNIKLLGWVEFYDYFYLIHYIMIYIAIMYVPYGRLLHVLATPITLIAYAFHEMHMREMEIN